MNGNKFSSGNTCIQPSITLVFNSWYMHIASLIVTDRTYVSNLYLWYLLKYRICLEKIQKKARPQAQSIEPQGMTYIQNIMHCKFLTQNRRSLITSVKNIVQRHSQSSWVEFESSQLILLSTVQMSNFSLKVKKISKNSPPPLLLQ